MNRSIKIACAAAVSLFSVAALAGQAAQAASCGLDGVSTGGRAAAACAGVLALKGVADHSEVSRDLFDSFGVSGDWELFGASTDGKDSVVAKGHSSGEWTVDFGDKKVDAFVVALKSKDAISVYLINELAATTSVISGAYDAILAGLIDPVDAPARALEAARGELAAAERSLDDARSALYAAWANRDWRAYWNAKSAYDDADDAYDEAVAAEREAEKALKKAEKAARKGKAHKQAQNQFNGFGEQPEIIVGTFASSSATAAAVPVPAALPLMASGFALFGGLAWRRRRAAK